ncbi:MAG: ABC transporter substrate-binding protein [Hylemonella sp.]|nr:ABC transporter substrate-binding protein [Hylemonella sp.]
MTLHRRLGFLALALGLLVAGVYFLNGGHSNSPMRRVAIVPFTAVNDRVVQGFRQTLADRGWVAGQNVEFQVTPADGNIGALDARVRTLLSWKPDLILAASTPPSQSVHRNTRDSRVPMIFAPVSDPIAAGIVKELAQPGENATGVRLASSNGLRLQWLKRMAPKAKVYYVPYSINDKSALVSLQQIEEGASLLGLKLVLHGVDSLQDIEEAAKNIPKAAHAIFLPQDSRIEARVELFVQSANKSRLPLSAPSLVQVERGALMSYGFDHYRIGEQAGRMGAAILAGADPGMLPVETAENFLAVNLRAAQQIGLEVDESVLRQARIIIR